jgi:hypothetical protein
MKELTLILAAGWVIESANAAAVIREDDAGFAAYAVYLRAGIV